MIKIIYNICSICSCIFTDYKEYHVCHNCRTGTPSSNLSTKQKIGHRSQSIKMRKK